MEAVIKCLLLKTDSVLIAEIIEIGSELGEPDCKLINPYLLKKSADQEYYLEWWLDFSRSNEFMIHSDSILTIVDPKEEILKKYLELVS
tara:strand:- start:5921 stop:6187 length:267 start_codon:yes stop_codon:yes gene_type:complete